MIDNPLSQEVLKNNKDAVLVEFVGPVSSIRRNVESRVFLGQSYGRFVYGERFYAYKQDAEKSHLLRIVEPDKKQDNTTTTRKRRKRKVEEAE